MNEEQEQVVRALARARKSGHNGWYRADCPFCADVVGKVDRRQSLSVKPSIYYYKCLRCLTRGRLPEDEDEVSSLVAAEEMRADPELTARPKVIDPPDGYELLGVRDAWEAMSLEHVTGYLVRRGVTFEAARRARVGVTFEGRYRNRIVVPVLDADEETWLGFSARDLTGDAFAKYLYPPGMDRGKLLYNQAAVYVESEEPLIAVEGVFDALPYFPDAVGFLGKPGKAQLDILLDSSRPVAVCLDGDAHEEGWAVAEMLKFQGLRAGAVRLPPGMDPNTVDRAWLRDEARRSVR